MAGPFGGGANVATITARLEAQTRDFDRNIQNSEQQVRKLEASAGRAGSGVSTMSKVMRGAAAAGVGAFAVQMFNLGIQVEAWGRRFNTVFEGATDSLEKWADAMNERLGMSVERLKGVAASVGDLFVPMGFTRKAAADLTKETLTLAAALSEWTGGTRSAEEAAHIITRAILGEREALIGLGVKISEADVQAALLEKGMGDLTGEALEQARAMVTLELITKKSADAMTAFEEGGSDAMRAANDFKASMDELKVTLGEALQNAMPLVNLLANIVKIVTVPFDTSIEKLDDALADAGGKAAEVKIPLNDADTVLRNMAASGGAAAAAIRDTASAMLEAANPALAAQKAVQRANEAIKNAAADGIITAEEWANMAGTILEANAAIEAFTAGGTHAEAAAIAEALGMPIAQAEELIRLWGIMSTFRLPTIGPDGVGLPGRTYGGGRAAGGPVSAGTPYMVGERGPEMFVPSRSGTIIPNGAGGVSVVVNVGGSVVSERDLVESIRRSLRAGTIRGGGQQFD